MCVCVCVLEHGNKGKTVYPISSIYFSQSDLNLNKTHRDINFCQNNYLLFTVYDKEQITDVTST